MKKAIKEKNDNKNIIKFILSYRFFLLLFFCIVLFDQLTKFFLVKFTIPYLQYNNDIKIILINNLLQIIFICNKGAIWGVFPNINYALGVSGFLTIITIIYVSKHIRFYNIRIQYIFGLIVGGITGNTIDRFLHGCVVDFISLYFLQYHYPVFNIADCAICLGVISYCLILLNNCLQFLNNTKNRNS